MGWWNHRPPGGTGDLLRGILWRREARREQGDETTGKSSTAIEHGRAKERPEGKQSVKRGWWGRWEVGRGRGVNDNTKMGPAGW